MSETSGTTPTPPGPELSGRALAALLGTVLVALVAVWIVVGRTAGTGSDERAGPPASPPASPLDPAPILSEDFAEPVRQPVGPEEHVEPEDSARLVISVIDEDGNVIGEGTVDVSRSAGLEQNASLVGEPRWLRERLDLSEQNPITIGPIPEELFDVPLCAKATCRGRVRPGDHGRAVRTRGSGLEGRAGPTPRRLVRVRSGAGGV